MHFSALAINIFVSLFLVSSASPVSDSFANVDDPALKHWLMNTDAKLTFIGKPPNPLSRRDDTMVVFCSNRASNVCGGPCSVYNGPSTCLSAPDTNCLKASKNVGFCDGDNCGGSCNDSADCGTPLDDGFCATPGTKSILVGQ